MFWHSDVEFLHCEGIAWAKNNAPMHGGAPHWYILISKLSKDASVARLASTAPSCMLFNALRCSSAYRRSQVQPPKSPGRAGRSPYQKSWRSTSSQWRQVVWRPEVWDWMQLSIFLYMVLGSSLLIISLSPFLSWPWTFPWNILCDYKRTYWL